MPYDDPEIDDPMMLVGVSLPGDESSLREAATVFAEEFARLGYTESMLMYLFQNSFYVGAHNALRVLGEESVRTIVREQVDFWGRLSYRDQDAVGDAGTDR